MMLIVNYDFSFKVVLIKVIKVLRGDNFSFFFFCKYDLDIFYIFMFIILKFVCF